VEATSAGDSGDPADADPAEAAGDLKLSEMVSVMWTSNRTHVSATVISVGDMEPQWYVRARLWLSLR
jgi:hypothetical protein